MKLLFIISLIKNILASLLLMCGEQPKESSTIVRHLGSTTMNKCLVKDIDRGANVCEPCYGQDHAEELCQKFRNCETCNVDLRKCSTCRPGKTGDYCMEDFGNSVFRFLGSIAEEPLLPENQERMKRHIEYTGICSVPDNIKTADVKCILYTDKVTCLATCAHGYTYSAGTSLNHSCKYSERKWVPHRITECSRYISCQVNLIGRGSLKCTTISMNGVNQCSISCRGDKHKPSVTEHKYTCDVHGDWHPPLPWCVEKRTDVYTVPPPPHRHH